MVSVQSKFMVETACQITRKLIAKNPVEPDHFGDYEAVQAWPLITALYSGIEQALKQLLLIPPTCFTLEELATRKYGHDLVALYTELGADFRVHIEQHFREHRSLHDYIPEELVTSAEDFIEHLNGGSPSRGLSWRYFLIDSSVDVPTTCLWTMSEIWDAICCCIGSSSHQPGCTRLRARLGDTLLRLTTGRPITYDGLVVDLNNWTSRHGDLLTAWVDLLVKADRNILNQVEAPHRLRNDLAARAHEALSHLSKSDDPDEMHLLRRIRQKGRFLVWDHNVGEFRTKMLDDRQRTASRNAGLGAPVTDPAP